MKKRIPFFVFLLFVSTLSARPKDPPFIRLSDDYMYVEKEVDVLRIDFKILLPGKMDQSYSCNAIELFYVSAVDSTLRTRIGAIKYEGKKRVRHRERERKKAGLPPETFVYKEKFKTPKNSLITRYHTGKTDYEDWMDDGVLVLFEHSYSPKIKKEMVLVRSEMYVPVLIVNEEESILE